jgi:carbon-monoxide dehydrogenase large subunit
MATGPYRVPQLELTAYGVVTNTSPTGPYRGAGRPEATAMLERAMDLLAAELGIDPVELRRRNLIGAEELPFTTATGASYDSGDYSGALAQLVERAGYAELRTAQDARRSAGDHVQLGIGVSVFVEVSGSGSEYGSVRIGPDGHAICMTGSSPHGQGHETTFAQIAADVLQMDIRDVELVHSDTAVVPRGTGTFGSRSGQLGGSAMCRASEVVVDRARRLAAELLEAAETDIVLVDGRIGVSGVPTRSFSWAELAAHAATPVGVELLGEDGLFAEDDFDQSRGTYPFGAHLALVEVDIDTGKVTLRRLVAVDDCGNVVNPMIVAGQVHGGLLQGIAQALYEEMSVDEMGNPQGTTLAEYGIPSAAEVPGFDVGHTVTPSPRNPLGMKGIGESGTVGATPAVQNAVLDALTPYGITHLDMPLTSLKIWEALRPSSDR